MSSSFRPWMWRIILVCGGWSTSSSAQSVNLVALEWSTLAGCSGPDVVVQRVNELAGSITRREALWAKGEVSAVASGVHLHLETRDAGQTFVRDVQLPTCEQAAETAALILAMAVRAELVEPGAVVPGASSEPAPTESASAPPPLAPVPAGLAATQEPLPLPQAPATSSKTSVNQLPKPELASAARTGPDLEVQPAQTAPNVSNKPGAPAPDVVSPIPSASWKGEPKRRFLSVGVGGVAAWGLIPKALWSVNAAGAVTFEPWRLEVVGAFAPSQRVSLASDATRGGEFVLWSAGLRGCYVAALAQTRQPLRGLACVGGEGGQLRGTGFGTGWSEEGIAPWWALNAGLGALLALTEQVKAVLRLELVAPLWRDRFVLQNAGDSSGEVARPGAVVGRVGVGVEVVF